ncbi:MAG: YeeE/YedE family protein [Bradymonadales bacterium]|nr:YeeE/YedE family protein [Bradymonadales bacterium]
MSELLPLAPQLGLSLIAYLAISLVIGLAFGFFLERAGFGSATNLTEIFILRDFRVFRVMFTAVLTGIIGSQLLHHLGVMNLGLVEFEANYFWSILSGGLLFGVGFYVGGFCPGTAVVSLARGRWDGLAFLFGIVLGIYGFALLFDGVSDQAWFMSFFAPADAARTTLYGDGPAWPWVLAITAIALAGFKAAPFIERRFRLKTVAELSQLAETEPEGQAAAPHAGPIVSAVAGRKQPQTMAELSGLAETEPEGQAAASHSGKTAPPAASKSLWRWLGPALAFGGALALMVIELARPVPLDFEGPDHRVAELSQETVVDGVTPQTLASWLIENAHRANEGLAPNVLVADLREESERLAHPVVGATPLSFANMEQAVEAAEVAAVVREALADIGQKPVVLLATDQERARRLVTGLRRHHVWAFTLEGGMEAWAAQLADPEHCFGAILPGAEDLAEPRRRTMNWLAGRSQELPPRLVCLGAIPPETQVAAAVATTPNRGGGCN